MTLRPMARLHGHMAEDRPRLLVGVRHADHRRARRCVMCSPRLIFLWVGSHCERTSVVE